jgi:hypothetical protein
MIMHTLLYIMEYLIIRFCIISSHMFLQSLFGYECIIYVSTPTIPRKNNVVLLS